MSSAQPVNAGPVPVPDTAETAEKSTKVRKAKSRKGKIAKSKPTKTLPNWRISVAKQFDVLRAYGAASNKGTRAASTEEAAEIVKMSPATVVMANAFLASIGLLKRADTGAYFPCSEIIDFLGAYEWDKKTASYKLAPKLKETWFAQALLPRLSFGDPVEEKQAITVLAEAAGNAGPEYERELRMLLEFMALGGLIQREGGQVKQFGKTPTVDAAPSKPSDDPVDIGTARSNRISSGYTSQTPFGGVDFNVSVQVDMAEFGTWHPDRIASFFKGIALVLAAKAGIEKEGAIS